MYRGVKHRFFESHNFRKFAGFWCGYCYIKHDKTASIVSILIKFHTIVVKKLILRRKKRLKIGGFLEKP